MTTHPPRPVRRRRGGRAGSTSLEFGLIGGTLLVMCIGTIDLGLLLWSQEVLQLAATETARCVALGASPCATPASYAVGIASQYSFTGTITTGNVWVQGNATCASTQGHVTAGNYTVVTITDSYWATLFSAFEPVAIALGANTARTVTACYPG